MSPGPRPPSPSERDATQRAARRENPNQLTARDASVLVSVIRTYMVFRFKPPLNLLRPNPSDELRQHFNIPSIP